MIRVKSSELGDAAFPLAEQLAEVVVCVKFSKKEIKVRVEKRVEACS
jgi:hypothetical protein